jgi:hypothetical protein
MPRKGPQILGVDLNRSESEAFIVLNPRPYEASSSWAIWPESPSSQFAPDIVAIEPSSLKHCLVTTEAFTEREFDVALSVPTLR